MNTPSHAIVAAIFHRPLSKWIDSKPDRLPPARMSALLIGSFIPDFLLTALAIVLIVRDNLVGAFDIVDFEQMEPGRPTPQEWLDASLTIRLFDIWFFENPWVITLQNLFHSPLLLVLYIAVAYCLWKRGNAGSGWLFWLSAAAMLHTLLDIPLHVDDGPLLLFPLNWTWRFASPVSYWDPRFYGQEWSSFEFGLDVVLLAYLGWIYRNDFRRWFGRRWQQIRR